VGAIAGDIDALQAYASRQAAIRSAYLDRRRSLYAREMRWPDRPFWRAALLS
jgi:hypothetical protein